jgi:phenylalanyl-tRNA synthetase beta chain
MDTPLPNGTAAISYFQLEPETTYEIGLTPNRVDAASHLGVARDLSAFLKRPIVFPETAALQKANQGGPILLNLMDSEACLRYAGLVVEEVVVQPSPDWMQTRLRSVGLNPINNLVDITNYVLHELGQPMHAFDVEKIEGKEIRIRKALPGEKLVLLDKTTRELDPTDLVIANARQPMALAGIMGGLDSGVGPSTKTVILESACFQPADIRKSAQSHGLKTDSSFRFERGSDPNMVIRALERAAFLIEETGAGKVQTLVVDQYPVPVENRKISISWKNVDRLIGEELPRETVYSILEHLEIHCKKQDDYGHPGFEEFFDVEIPPYRVDVLREADIVEEILRVYGFDRIETGQHLKTDFIASRLGTLPEKRQQRASQLLSDMGFRELTTNSLTHSELMEGLAEFKNDSQVHLLNKLSEDLGMMRQTMLFSGLEALAYNLNRRQNHLKFFEVGKTYGKNGDRFFESYGLDLFVTGQWLPTSWEHQAKKAGFFDLRKSIKNLLERLGFAGVQAKEGSWSFLDFGQKLIWNQREIGFLGRVKSDIARRKDLKQEVWYGHLDWEFLRKANLKELKFQEVSKFPEVVRDLSVVVDQAISFEAIEQRIRQVNRKLIREISVFDVYQGDKIEQGKKAYAMSIVLQDDDATLTDTKIDGTMQAVMQRLEKDLGVLIRK